MGQLADTCGKDVHISNSYVPFVQNFEMIELVYGLCPIKPSVQPSNRISKYLR